MVPTNRVTTTRSTLTGPTRTKIRDQVMEFQQLEDFALDFKFQNVIALVCYKGVLINAPPILVLKIKRVKFTDGHSIKQFTPCSLLFSRIGKAKK